MSEENENLSAPKNSRDSLPYMWLVLLGGGALMMAMVVDVVAVFGRATRMSLLGSIEIVQYVVGISGATGLVVATIRDSHATVKIVINRLRGWAYRVAWAINSLCAAAFFVALFTGSVWVLLDLWYGYEETEYWRLPYKPLRIYIAGVMLVVVALFIGKAWRGRKS